MVRSQSERRSNIVLAAATAGLVLAACTTVHEPRGDTSGTEPVIASAALATVGALTTAVSSADEVPRDVSGPRNDGCIDTQGTIAGGAPDWYREDAEGIVTLDIGVAHFDTPGSAALARLASAASGPAAATNTWEYTAAGDPSCVIGRGAAAVAPDGTQLRISVWRLTAAVRPSSLPHHAPFVLSSPDLLVSDASRDGDITVLKVLADGTTIKVVALGIGALGFAGWPTTIAPRPDALTPAPPAQRIADLAALAAQVAATL